MHLKFREPLIAILRACVAAAATFTLLPAPVAARCIPAGFDLGAPREAEIVTAEDREEVEALTQADLDHVVCAHMRSFESRSRFIGGGSGTRGFLALSTQHAFFVSDRRRKTVLLDIAFDSIAELHLQTHEIRLGGGLMFATLVTEDDSRYVFTYDVDRNGSPLANHLCRRVRMCRRY